MLGAQQPGHRMNGEYLERFLFVEWRQDARQSAGEHGFTGAWWSHQQEIVGSGGGDLQRAHGEGLPYDVTEFWCVIGRRLGASRARIAARGAIAQCAHEFQESAGGHGAGAGHAQRFGQIVRRYDQQGVAGRGHMPRHSEHPAYAPELSIESQFTHGTGVLQRLGGELSAGGKQGEGDGEIEGGAGFRQIARLQIHRDPSRWNRESRIGQRRVHAVSAFLHCRRGETDERPLR